MAASALFASSAALPDAVWRGNQLGACRVSTVASGYAALDRELPGGGWPSSSLTEFLLPHPGVGELRLLGPALGALTQAGKTVIFLGPPHIPFAFALQQLGLDLRRLLLIHADKPADRVWAVEQALKSASFGALLCWLPQVQTEQMRRLQVAASGSDGLAFVFRPLAAQTQSSPAPLRIACQCAPAGRISVEIIKRRGPTHAAPLAVPLPIHPVLAKPLAKRMTEPSLPVPHAVDRHSFSATAARRRATFLA